MVCPVSLEHVRLEPTAGTVNSIPVNVTDIAFEGNFISIKTEDAAGRVIVSEIRNDGSATIPDRGARLFANFETDHAFILADETTTSAAGLA